MTTSPQLDPAPGLEVLGYRLVRRLGKGGFGEVWLATGPGEFEVAVKFVQRQTGAEKAEQRSLQILRVVKHHYLLSVFAAAEVGRHLVIVMELASGSLHDLWRENWERTRTGLPRNDLLRYLANAAEGLDYLNAPRHTIDGRENVSIQHRDIKPHNLLFVGDAVKVADFGLARLQEGSAASHSGSMTIAYAPPEFFENRTTTRSDQFSLAATYCHLRTGKLPFGDSLHEVLARHLHTREGPDLTALPEGEREVVAKALSRQAGDRYPSSRHFMLALREATRGKTIRPVLDAIPVGLPAPPEKTKPNPRAAAFQQQETLAEPDVTEPAPSPRRKRKPRLVWWVLAFFVAIPVGLAVAFGYWVVMGVAEIGHNSNNLKQIAAALHNYHDTYRCFPPAAFYPQSAVPGAPIPPGTPPLYSWRVALLPYLECDPLHQQFHKDEPWDSPANLAVLNKMPDVFRSPKDPAGSTGTRYKVIVTPRQQPFGSSMFREYETTTMNQITDGTSNTIMVIDKGAPVPWTKPEDIPFDPQSATPLTITERDQYSGRIFAVTADGTIHRIPADLDPTTLKAMITRDGGESFSWDH